MGEALRILVFVMAFVSCNALLELSGVHQVKGTWMGSTTLPCTYTPSKGFTQQTLSWSVEKDYSTSTIFRRDDTGDHILLSRFRDRVSVPKNSPGDASLLIENLEIPDNGHYTCQVIWRLENNSLITKQLTTTVKVVKVPVTKPVIKAGELGLTVPAGARTSLTCVASGSPPISYLWFRSTPGQSAQLLSNQAELVWDSLQPSDAGTYYCEAKNKVGTGTAQQSDTVELRVRESPVSQKPSTGTSRQSRPPPIPRGDAPQPVPTDLPAAATLASRRDAVSEGLPIATGSPAAAYPPHLYAVAAALGGAALGALAAGLLWRRLRKKEDTIYEVAFHSTGDVTRLETDVEAPYTCLQKETHSKAETSNDTLTLKDDGHNSVCIRKDPEYENLMSAMEVEFEAEKNY